MLNILLLFPSKIMDSRGTPNRVRSIISSLSLHDDFCCYVFSCDDKLNIDGVKQHYPLSPSIFVNIFRVYTIIKEKKIDIVVGHTMSSLRYLIPACLFTKAKLVLEMHGFVEEEALDAKQISIFRYFLLKIIHVFYYYFCDLITTCSETAATVLRRYNKNVLAIFGGVDLILFNKDIVPSENFHTTDNEVVIGYAGNSRAYQGLDFLLDFFVKFKLKHPMFKLVLLVDEATKIEDRIGMLVIKQRDHKYVPGFLAACDMLIIPRPENVINRLSFPSKLPEYLAMGKLVISSDIADANKIITHGQNGLLYQPGNFVELEKCLVLAKNVDFRKKMGYNAYLTASKTLAWVKQVDLLSNELKKIVK